MASIAAAPIAALSNAAGVACTSQPKAKAAAQPRVAFGQGSPSALKASAPGPAPAFRLVGPSLKCGAIHQRVNAAVAVETIAEAGALALRHLFRPRAFISSLDHPWHLQLSCCPV